MAKLNKTALRALIMLCCAALVLPLAGSGAYAAGANADRGKGMKYKDYFQQQIDGYVGYLNELALDNGVIPMTRISYSSDFSAEGLEVIDGVEPSQYINWKCGNIIPYFTEFAVLGLLAAAPETSRELTEGFIDWYIANLNTAQTDRNGIDGTVYDSICFVDPKDSSHIITVSKRALYANQFADQKDNTYDYDSTDAYAGCFLRVVAEYVKIYPQGKAFIEGKRVSIDRIVNAMLATYCPNIDLTGAKPTYMVCYLMDNCEVYDGCVSAAGLYRDVFGDGAEADRLEGIADKIETAIEKQLFNAEDGTYYAYCFDNGKNDGTIDWNTFYADATCQLFPARFGLLAPDNERAKTLYDTFNSYYMIEGKDWRNLTHGDGFPWASICTAASVMGDIENVLAYTQTMDKRYASRNYNYPMYNAEAGQMLLSLSNMLKSGDPALESYIGGEPAVSEAESEQESEAESANSDTSVPEKTDTTLKAAIIAAAALAVAGIAAVLIFGKKKKK